MPIKTSQTGRAALRVATNDAHERLHRHPVLSQLADGTISRNDYRWLLTRWWGFHRAVEDRLAVAPLPPGFDLAARSKVDALRSDLRSVVYDDAAIAALPLCPGIPALDSPAAAIGCAYVVEGSTMGGRVMAKALDPMLGSSNDGRRFLLGYGSRHGAMWREFLTLIEVVAGTRASCDAMTGAAQQTFDAFEGWLASA